MGRVKMWNSDRGEAVHFGPPLFFNEMMMRSGGRPTSCHFRIGKNSLVEAVFASGGRVGARYSCCPSPEPRAREFRDGAAALGFDKDQTPTFPIIDK